MVTAADRFGIWLRGTRQRLGISQERLAELTGIDRGHISKIENGQVKLPLYETRQKFHAALGTTEGELVERGIVGAGNGQVAARAIREEDVTYVVVPPDEAEQGDLRQRGKKIIDDLHPLKLRWALDQLERIAGSELIGLGVQSVRSGQSTTPGQP